jgi:hypothetical protein
MGETVKASESAAACYGTATSGGESERESPLRQGAVRTHQVGLIATGPTRCDVGRQVLGRVSMDGWMDGWGRGKRSGSRSIL